MSQATLDRLRAHLEAARTLRGPTALDRSGPAAQARHAVRAFQAARLRQTYADLNTQVRYQPAVAFFLADLYSTADQSVRDAQLERALPKLVRYLPAGALEPIGLALELDALSERLDERLAQQLGVKAAAPIESSDYAQAYRACANSAERERQIGLTDTIGRTLDRIAHTPGVGTAVMLMRGPARAAGFDTLQSFLERGLAAFKHMRTAATFLETIAGREAAINARLFAGDPDPFRIES